MDKPEIDSRLLDHKNIFKEWEKSPRTSQAAAELTLAQIDAFEKLIQNDEGWEFLLSVFNNGRDIDAWLAFDWPQGFDELLLCVPLCSLVKFECDKCTIGRRQNNNSCAHDDSLFGYTAEIIKRRDREGLKKHVQVIKIMLTNDNYKWNMKTHCIDKF